jgi:D-aminoacyl-tRNA deacylase
MRQVDFIISCPGDVPEGPLRLNRMTGSRLRTKQQSWTLDPMRAAIQRVSRAKVVVDGEIVGEIGRGLLVLLGVGQSDTTADADYIADKTIALRVFEDDTGKMNRAVAEVGGAVLVVSQFTLYGDVRRGKRPSFDVAAPPQKARELYEYFVNRIRGTGLRCETGKFQEMMQVELVNNGPVTILVDSTKTF